MSLRLTRKCMNKLGGAGTVRHNGAPGAPYWLAAQTSKPVTPHRQDAGATKNCPRANHDGHGSPSILHGEVRPRFTSEVSLTA